MNVERAFRMESYAWPEIHTREKENIFLNILI
jgi:hypothetical protein